MRDHDFDAFNAMLSDVASLYGRDVNPKQVAMYFRILSPHSLSEVQVAFDAHAKSAERGRFWPLPADLLVQLERIAAEDGRPSPEEAWAIASASADEAMTVVWTAETSAAWWAVAQPLMDIGDRFNASRGFLAKYADLVAESRKNGVPVCWEVSQGSDKSLRHQALEAAYKSGRISRETVRQMLPRHSGDTGPIVAALVSNVVPLLSGPRAVAAPESTERAAEVSAAQRRLSDLIKSSQKQPQASQRRDPAQSRRIVLDAELRGVIVGIAELDSWMTRANAGEDVSELQVSILDSLESRHA